MSKWFYTNEQGEKIEITGGQLKWLAQNGKITPETIIETEEGKSAPARKVKGLTFSESEDAIQPMPAQPAASVNPSIDFNNAINNAVINSESSNSPLVIREPAPGQPLAEIFGVAGILKVFDDKIAIQKESRGSKTLYYSRISSTQFSGADKGKPGFLQMTFAGSSDLQGTGEEAIKSAILDENSFVFLLFQNELVSTIRDFIDAKIAGADTVNERNALLTIFSQYKAECDRQHYTLSGVGNCKTLSIFGDRAVINNFDPIFFTTLTRISNRTAMVKGKPVRIGLESSFGYAPPSKRIFARIKSDIKSKFYAIKSSGISSLFSAEKSEEGNMMFDFSNPTAKMPPPPEELQKMFIMSPAEKQQGDVIAKYLEQRIGLTRRAYFVPLLWPLYVVFVPAILWLIFMIITTR